MQFRAAKVKDLTSIAMLHVKSWRENYRQIMAQQFGSAGKK